MTIQENKNRKRITYIIKVEIGDDSTLITMAEEVIANNEKPVNDYLNGKEQAIKSLMGQIMKEMLLCEI